MEFEDNAKREFLGVWIPKEIWINKDLSINEKALYAEINSFTSKDKACFISNRHIADFLGTSETNASKILNNLIDKGYVVVEKFDGRRRYIRATQTRKNDNPASNNGQYTNTNNISNNNTNDNITSTNVDVPSDNASAGKRKKEKVYSLQHRCRLFFEDIYTKTKGDNYYYSPKDASALKGILQKIKFLMPENEKEDENKIEWNFQYFISAIAESKILNTWIKDNFSLPIINSKFNEIYAQLKNGTTRQPSAADIKRAFGSRNITPDILDILT